VIRGALDVPSSEAADAKFVRGRENDAGFKDGIVRHSGRMLVPAVESVILAPGLLAMIFADLVSRDFFPAVVFCKYTT
jgi:hypothetical protein